MDCIADPRWQYALVLRKSVTKIRPKDGLAPARPVGGRRPGQRGGGVDAPRPPPPRRLGVLKGGPPPLHRLLPGEAGELRPDRRRLLPRPEPVQACADRPDTPRRASPL